MKLNAYHQESIRLTKEAISKQPRGTLEQTIRQYQTLNGRDPETLHLHPEMERKLSLKYRDKKV